MEYGAAVRESKETVGSGAEGCGAGARAEKSDTQMTGETGGVIESRQNEFMVSKPRFYRGFLGEIPPPSTAFYLEVSGTLWRLRFLIGR